MVTFAELLTLEPHGPDTFVGIVTEYPWGRVYGGQVAAQALRAAAETVDSDYAVHSLHAYFIRGGVFTEPIRFEVDRIRNGRSFVTRRVVARQSSGAIFNLSASFQRSEAEADVELSAIPDGTASPDELPEDDEVWAPMLRRRWIERDEHSGRSASWIRLAEDLGDDPVLAACGLTYMSDDIPTDAAFDGHPLRAQNPGADDLFVGASLDHSIWFHRPAPADAWQLHDFRATTIVGGRGLAIGRIHAADGMHIATVTQEVLMRERTH